MVLNKVKFIRLRLRGNSREKDELAVAELGTKKTVALFMWITGPAPGHDPTVKLTWMSEG